MAQVCFIFGLKSITPLTDTSAHTDEHASSPIRRMYAFVLWFDSISSPIPHIRLRTVKKLVGSNGSRIGGVVPLDAIKYPCALAPVLDESFDDQSELENPPITEDNCMDVVDTFYLNCFAGHVDYQLLA